MSEHDDTTSQAETWPPEWWQVAAANRNTADRERQAISDVTATIETRCGGKVPSDIDVNVAISSVLSASPFWPRSSSSLRQHNKGGNDDQIRSTR
jgi:hypothetical protein